VGAHKMDESIFQSEFSHSLHHAHGPNFFHKIVDQIGQFVTAKRPFDCFLIINGKIFCFELKQVREPSGFTFERVEKHQEWFLSIAAANGARSFIVINYRFESDKKQRKKYGVKKKENFVIAINIDYYEIIKNIFKAQIKKSIPLDFILEIYRNGFIGCEVIEWIPDKKMWDVSKLLDQ
jgi:penicillin-binding protein-related factor A (putative recombinase)